MFSIDTPFIGRRWWRFFFQKRRRGFSDRETWSLYRNIAIFVLPRLKRFAEVNIGYPPELTESEWKDILNQMIYSFEMVVDEDWPHGLSPDDIRKTEDRIDNGITLFAKYYPDLWW